MRQEAWAHLAVHHCMTRIIIRLAGQERIDPDRISFVKVLKHVRRSVIRQCAQTSVQIKQFTAAMAAKVCRKPGNGARRLREADRFPQAPGLEVLLPQGRPGPSSYPPGDRQGAQAPSRDSSESQATALGARREVADGDLQAGLAGQRRQLGLPQPGAVAVGPSAVGADQQPGSVRVGGLAGLVPPGAVVGTAKAAVSWSVPTLPHPEFARTSYTP